MFNYVAAVKLTLSDLRHECLFDNSYSLCPNKGKYQEDDGWILHANAHTDNSTFLSNENSSIEKERTFKAPL